MSTRRMIFSLTNSPPAQRYQPSDINTNVEITFFITHTQTESQIIEWKVF